MLRSLFSGVSGLRNHQVRMDVIGNNVANVNTVAFKSGRVTFKEGFAQLMQGATRGSGDQGGTNPMQVGVGMQVGSMDTLFTQGNIEATGNTTDLAIQGPSFFVVSKGAQQFYTRSGNFAMDSAGRLVSPMNGFVVQGRMAENGRLGDSIGDITLPFGQKVPASATTRVSVSGNLDAAAKVFDQGDADELDALDPAQRALAANAGSYRDLGISVFDSQGKQHELKLVLWKTDANQWEWKVDTTGMDITDAGITEVAGTHPFTFTEDGALDTESFTAPKLSFTPAGGGAEVTITIDPGSLATGGLTQFAGVSSAVIREQDGFGAGTLQSFTIDRSGTINGSFSNGTTAALAQLVLADFNNPSGLMRVGDNTYQMSGNSGAAVNSFIGNGSESVINSGALELSNVDLAQEFTNMIVAQRGFQANGRVITTSDQMLEELVNIKR